jgi:hypothetical protein
MKLDEFISETVKSVIKGLDDCKEFAIEHNARINPRVRPKKSDENYIFYNKEEGAVKVSKIDFDVAVTVTEKEENGIKAGISVYGIGLGAKTKGTEENKTISRINFSVDIALPNTDYNI